MCAVVCAVCLTWPQQNSASNFSATVINVTTDAAALLMEIEPDYAQQANDAVAMAKDVQDNIDTVLNILDKVEIARYANNQGSVCGAVIVRAYKVWRRYRFVFFLAIYAGLLLVVLCTFVFVWFFRNFLFCMYVHCSLSSHATVIHNSPPSPPQLNSFPRSLSPIHSNFWYSWLVFIFIFLILTLCVALGTVVSDVCDVYDDAQDGDVRSPTPRPS
jgi:hypothetical protein